MDILLDWLFKIFLLPLEVIDDSPVMGIPAALLFLGGAGRLLARWNPGGKVILGISIGLAVVTFCVLFIFLVLADAMGAIGTWPAFGEILVVFLGAVLLGGVFWLSYYYWRFVWPVCIVIFLVGLFFCGGIKAIKSALF